MGVGGEAGGSVGLAGTGVGAHAGDAGEAQPIERQRMNAKLMIGIIGCNVL
jgi:hypothetical protein